MIRWLGQNGDDVAEDAAEEGGQAAADEVRKGPWPPTRETFQVAGAAAGYAAAAGLCAGAVATAPFAAYCGAAGAALGAFVGGTLYDIGDSLAAKSVGVDPVFVAEVTVTRMISDTLNCFFADPNCAEAVQKWSKVALFGPPQGDPRGDRFGINATWGTASPFLNQTFFSPDQLKAWQKEVTAALTGLVASRAIKADAEKVRLMLPSGPISQSTPSGGGGPGPVLLGVAAVGGVLWWLLG